MEPWITDDDEWKEIANKLANDTLSSKYSSQLDLIPIEEIEKYLRKKKLEALKSENREIQKR